MHGTLRQYLVWIQFGCGAMRCTAVLVCLFARCWLRCLCALLSWMLMPSTVISHQLNWAVTHGDDVRIHMQSCTFSLLFVFQLDSTDQPLASGKFGRNLAGEFGLVTCSLRATPSYKHSCWPGRCCWPVCIIIASSSKSSNMEQTSQSISSISSRFQSFIKVSSH